MKQGGMLMTLMLLLPAAQAGTLNKGVSFTEARVQLIGRGWTPVNVHASDNYEYIGTETALIGAHIDEVESCAMDRPMCIFNYRRGRRCLRLVTQGEELPDMRVESWSFRCPKP